MFTLWFVWVALYLPLVFWIYFRISQFWADLFDTTDSPAFFIGYIYFYWTSLLPCWITHASHCTFALFRALIHFTLYKLFTTSLAFYFNFHVYLQDSHICLSSLAHHMLTSVHHVLFLYSLFGIINPHIYFYFHSYSFLLTVFAFSFVGTHLLVYNMCMYYIFFSYICSLVCPPPCYSSGMVVVLLFLIYCLWYVKCTLYLSIAAHIYIFFIFIFCARGILLF